MGRRWAASTARRSAIVFGLALVACNRPALDDEAAQRPWFDSVIDSSGIDFLHRSGAEGRYLFPEIASSGVCLLDYDGDGLLDIYFVQGGPVEEDRRSAALSSDRLYRNLGGLRFEDRTSAAGLGDTAYGFGCATGDFDANGWTDLYVTNLGKNILYANVGDGTFEDVSAASGADVDGWGASAGFGDFDQDGILDLFVVNYIGWQPHREIECHERGRRDYCSPLNYNAPARDRLLLGNGTGGFVDASEAWGLDRAFGNGFGLRLGDFDLDGDLDAFVANDGMANQLWINQGNGALVDEAILRGVALNSMGLAEAGMGVAAGDIDGDGDEDLVLSHLDEETNTLYSNRFGVFEDLSARTGIGPSSRGRTGFGTSLADFDNDGLLDLFVANGRVKHGTATQEGDDPYAELDLLLRGTVEHRFEPVPSAGLASGLVATSRGAAVGDLDNDGALDIVVSNRDARPHLLHNVIGADASWTSLRVLDSGRNGLGARVELRQGPKTQWRTVSTNASYCSAVDHRIHFGLGDSGSVFDVLVHWPGGDVEKFGGLAAERLHVLERGAGSSIR